MALSADVMSDRLRARDITDRCEVELRMSIHSPFLLHSVREQMMGRMLADATYSQCCVLYNDATDVRCVDGKWQRKRNMYYYRLPMPVPTSLVVSVESDALPPDGLEWTSITRKRWSYMPLQHWRLDFTTSERSSNIELEYVGPIQQVACQVYHLPGILCNLHACMAFIVLGSSRKCVPVCPTSAFVRLDLHTCPISRGKRDLIARTLQQCQPISLTSKSPALSSPLVSLKYDGIRMAVCTLKHRQKWFCIGVCRRGEPWLIPCLHASEELVLDCEFVSATNTFVVFDLHAVRGRRLTSEYRERLRDLTTVALPTLACQYKMCRKTFYPLSVLTTAWYEKQSCEHKIDGLIIHDSTSRLGQPSNMYKWKAQHTVDLYVSGSGKLMDGKYSEFLPTSASSTAVIRKGEIWECIFTGGGTHVLPVRRRTDKSFANARHVCREILAAHKDNLTPDNVATQLAHSSSIRSSKRKRV